MLEKCPEVPEKNTVWFSECGPQICVTLNPVWHCVDGICKGRSKSS